MSTSLNKTSVETKKKVMLYGANELELLIQSMFQPSHSSSMKRVRIVDIELSYGGHTR